MFAKIINFTLIAIVSALLGAHSSPSTPNETEKLVELTERLDRLQNKVETLESENVELTERLGTLQTKVATLESENEMLTTRFDDLKMENAEIKSDVKELKVQVSEQDEEILMMKSHITNLESLLAPKWTWNDGTNQSSNENSGPLVRALGQPPSSCQEWLDGSKIILADGIYLVKNKNTNNVKKIQAVFCKFSSSNVAQELVGTVDIKTKNTHFYVQRNSNFGPGGGIISFELARINEGNIFNLKSGIFTAPVPGIYHFDFTALKSSSSTFLDIWLQVNDINVGYAWTDQGTKGSWDVVSLSASLRLAAGDRVFLYNWGGLLADLVYFGHHTHFSGWLVEEDLM